MVKLKTDPEEASKGVSTIALYRPVGKAEFELIRASRWKSFPPRLAGQPFFYPVLTEEYAEQIAREWNTQDGGTGYVLRFYIHAKYLERFSVRTVGARVHREYWIPSDELAEFNNQIVGQIELVSSFQSAHE